MTKDPRPILEQVKSGLKIGGIMVALLVLGALVISLIPVHRVEAYVWHLRHGNFVGIGNVRFPVPKHWYVKSESPNDVLLVNLDNGDSVSMWLNKQPKAATLAVWSRLQERSLDHNTQITAKREISLAGETLLCMEHDDDLQRFICTPSVVDLKTELKFYSPRNWDWEAARMTGFTRS
jgi:hypothetical protein